MASAASQLVQQGESVDASSDYKGNGYIVWSTAGVAFLLSSCLPLIGFIPHCHDIMSQVLDPVGIVYIVWSTAGVAFLLSGVFLFVMTLCPKFLLACYTYCVLRCIPFAAAANLNTGMTAVKANGCIFIMAYVSVALTWDYIRAWFIAVIDVNDQTNIVDENLHWKCSQSKYTRSYRQKW
eukprot:scaffold34877_cov39-Cyclotella_meneghiniana.AAC.6